MPVNSTHAEYDDNADAWSRARDVIAGEAAVKAGGTRYLPRLDSQSDDDYAAYKGRASFFNATARTLEGFIGLIFRRPPFIKVPGNDTALGRTIAEFLNDADLLGTPFIPYAKNVVSEVVAVGRAGTLIDWEGGTEERAYASLYRAEDILNWKVERVEGRNIPTMVVLREPVEVDGDDGFTTTTEEQIRVLRLVGSKVTGQKKTPGEEPQAGGRRCMVEVWRKAKSAPSRLDGTAGSRRRGNGALPAKGDWDLLEERVPLRLGKPLPLLLLFVFHGPRHSWPACDKLPLADIIAVNLDHYRLDADYKHGIHFTALPTAWVSGFDKSATLRIGSSTAWVTETTGATAGFLEFTGHGLITFERAMDRDERLLAVLGSRLLESQKKVGETAQAIELRQSGENSVLGNAAANVGASLTQVMRWVHWWNSTEASTDDVAPDRVLVELNADFSAKGLAAEEITAVVSAWQAGAISRDTMTELFRRGEVLPEGRTVEEERVLVGKDDYPAGLAIRPKAEDGPKAKTAGGPVREGED